MNRVLLLASLLALTCCAAPQSEEAALMDRIEQQVRMPEGAGRITQYDRYYADAGDEKVIGLYLGASSDGERQWLADKNRMSGVEDGGCDVVHVIFDQRAGKIESIWCNGVA